MDIKLIPKEYKHSQEILPKEGFKIPFINKTVNFRSLFNLEKRTNFFLNISIILLVICFLLFGGLFAFQKYYLSEKRAGLEAQVEELNTQRDVELEEHIREFNKTLLKLQEVKKERICSSRLFEILEELTVARVQFVNFSADLSKSQLSLTGQAADYDILSQQISVLENDTRIKEVKTSNIELGVNQVSFNFNLKLDSNFLR